LGVGWGLPRVMSAIFYWVAVLAFGPGLWAEANSARQTPTYSAASIVNAASNEVGALAPNTFATIYGVDLAYATRAMAPTDIGGGLLPTVLDPTGVRVLVDGIPAIIYYASPTQVNLLIPSLLRRPEVELRLVLDSKAGPGVTLRLLEAAPALFQLDGTTPVATRADWSVITAEAPARPGEDVILYATGLGSTEPETIYGRIPQMAARIQRWREFQVVLDSVPVEPGRIAYVGVMPGYAGLYQINLKLPETLENDPEIRIGLAGQISRPGLRLPVRVPESKSPQRLPSGMR
jgi:uncharacterized protein (TIGR03437 family)